MPPIPNTRQERFAQGLVRGFTEVKAYKFAGYTGKAQKRANRVAQMPQVRARVAELSERVSRGAVMVKQEALETLTRIARATIADFLSRRGAGRESVIMDALQDPTKAAAIRELATREDARGSRIKSLKLHSPLEAIQILAKMEGWEAPLKHEFTKRLEDMTDSELIAMMSGGAQEAGS